MIKRDELSPEEREIYDKTYAGSIDRLDREMSALKRAIIEAMPPILRRFVTWFISR